jgi:serine/threonine protein phosphatase PrpC
MIHAFSFSELGQGHATNQDAFQVRRHPADEDCWLCTLADGQGGQFGGERAAKISCRAAMDAAADRRVGDLTEHGTWVTVIHAADKSVAADPDAGHTALLAFCVVRGRLLGASNGDCALLAQTTGRVEEVTKGQRKDPPIGSGCVVGVPFATNLVSPWLILAMSDGVWKYVSWQHISETTGKMRGQAIIDSLQAQARLPRTGRFQDDFTLVVLQNRE